MQVYLLLVYALVTMCWRRWAGKTTNTKRFFKYVVLTLIFLCMYYTSGHFLQWEMLAIPALIRCMNKSHGDYYHIYDKDKDEGRCKIIDKILQWIFGKDGYYNVKGNITGLFLTRFMASMIAAYWLPNMIFFPVTYTITYVIVEGIMKANGEGECTGLCEYANGFIYALLIYSSLLAL